MERLTLSRPPKKGDKVECLPAGDGLPIWTKITLDKKLPMMKTPKDSVVLCTTKLGEPKHRCKQECDFDLRDPNGKYADNMYESLHDPHLKTHFSTPIMRRHLIKKGFISEEGKILCTLKQFNLYRRYLRHIFFLEIARERKGELEARLKKSCERQRYTDVQRQTSHGSVVRSRLKQQREHDLVRLQNSILDKSHRLERRLQQIRDDMTVRETRQREEAERRQTVLLKNLQDNENRDIMLLKRWRHRDHTRRHLMEDRDTQRHIRAEMKCMAKWNARKDAQRAMLDRENEIIKQEDEYRFTNVTKRETTVSRQWGRMEKKIERCKQTTRQEKDRKEELQNKRLEERLAAIDAHRNRRRVRRRSAKKTLISTWKLEDVLQSFEVPGIQSSQRDPSFMEMLNAAIDDAVEIVTQTESEEDAIIEDKAREIVNDVISKVKNEIYPQYLHMLQVEEADVTKSKSVRFSSTEEEIAVQGVPVAITVTVNDNVEFKPVSEHIVTPCASHVDCAKTEALLGSPVQPEKSASVNFVESLLLRLLDDLNCGRLTKEDIMKLASYSMDIIQSSETEATKDASAPEVGDEDDAPYLVGSSSSIIATKMVDFTLSKILSNIQSGHVHPGDLASLTVSLLDNVSATESSSSISNSELENYVDDTLLAATSSALDPREDSPICDALLDDFMVRTLQNLIRDLENETLTMDQIQNLAASVKEETKTVMPYGTGDELTGQEGIQNVLEDVLSQLQSGNIDFQTMYQVVFAIVYSYKRIKEPSSSDFECKVTNLIKELLATVEQKASTGEFEDVNINIVREANNRLSTCKLDHEQIEQISPCIVGVADNSELVCKTSTSEMARSFVEDALTRAKEKLDGENSTMQLQQSVQNVAEAVLTAIPDRKQSPTYVDVFVQVLEALRGFVEENGGIVDMSPNDIDNLIAQISTQVLLPTDVLKMAESVARVMKSPVQSDSSFTADIVVKNSLKEVLKDMTDGALEGQHIQEIVQSLKRCYKAAEMRHMKSPALLESLASFLRSILDSLSYQLQTGDMTDEDMQDISSTMKDKVIGNTESVTLGELSADHILLYIHQLVEDVEQGNIEKAQAHDIGTKLIECGRKLVLDQSKRTSGIATPQTEVLADDLVEEVIRTLQLEIESGNLNSESLKEMTKAIIVTSTSDAAIHAVDSALKGIYKDIERGYHPSEIPSVAVVQSPSASTVASNVVMQTIDSINRDISSRGIPPKMISSIASTVISMLTGEDTHEDLPSEMERFRPTIENIVHCLKTDQVENTYAEEIFCLVLSKYKEFVLDTPGVDSRPERPIPDEDANLVNALVTETLLNVERSVVKGHMNDKDFSIPSIQPSDTGHMINTCIANVRHEGGMPIHDIVDFILDIVSTLQSELADGTISDLSMAHFYQAISSDEHDLKSLETNAAANLTAVTRDIKDNRDSSVYIDRIIQTYLDPRNVAAGVFSDPVKAIESILINVSSEILTKFVKATLQTILMEMRADAVPLHERPPSVYVLRSASSLIAENVIKEVISRIKDDMSKSIHNVQGTVSRKELERTASRLRSESKNSESKITGIGVVSSRQSLSSVNSKEIEDIVLDTLHNIVSNLRLEHSMSLQKPLSIDSDISQEIQDFVLNTLQNIVADQQDKRSQIDIGATRSSSKHAGSSMELLSGESKEAVAYVNEMLHNVLEEMKQELIEKKSNVSENGEDSSSGIQTTILDSIQKALSEVTPPNQSSDILLNYQRDEVKCILSESIRGTIENIKANKFEEADLRILYNTCKRVCCESGQLDDTTGESITTADVAKLMEEVLVKVQTFELQDGTLDEISTQLATLGMDNFTNEREFTDDASVTSSKISNLVIDVIHRIAQQLESETVSHDTNANSGNLTSGQKVDTGIIKNVNQSESVENSSKKNRNYNRRLSASTNESDSSVKSSNTPITKLGKVASRPPVTPPKGKTNAVLKDSDPEKTRKTLSNRSTDIKPVVCKPHDTQKTQVDIRHPVAKKNADAKMKFVGKVQSFAAKRHSPVSAYTETKISRTPKPEIKHSQTIARTPPKVSKPKNLPTKPPIQKSSTPTKSVQKRRPSNKDVPHYMTPIRAKETSQSLKVKCEDKKKIGGAIPASEGGNEGPLHLRSLCGSHKTEIHIREETGNGDENAK